MKKEEELKESEEKYKFLFLHSPIGTGISDLNGNVIEMNLKMQEITGYTPEEAKELNLNSTYVNPEDRQKLLNSLKKEGKVENYEVRLRKKDGTIYWASLNISLNNLNGKEFVLTNCEDITEKKHLEIALMDSERNFKDLVKNSPFGVILANKEGIHIYANQSAAEITGYSVDELIGMSGWDLTRPEDIEKYKKRMNNRIKKKPYKKVYKRIIIRKDGNEILTELHSTTTRWMGEIIPMVCFKDITNQKKAEESLKENQQFMIDVFNAIQDGISVLDRDLNITYVNQWMEKAYSSQMPLIGKKCYSVYQRRQTICTWCPSIPAIETGEKKSSIVPYPSEGNPTGWIDLTSFPLRNNKGELIGVIEHVKDITKQKKAEIKLRESYEKVDFFKDLLAHDMGNILTNIKVSMDLMEMGENDQNRAKQERVLIETIHKQIDRGASLISNVRKLSEIEMEKEVIQAMNVKSVVEKAINTTKARYQENIDILIDFPQDKIIAKAGILLYEAFHNILINGVIHNDSDKVQIKIKISRIKEKNIRFVKIEFKDNGIGIIDERKKLIFERNYKKERSKGGMGIGLSLVKSIIENYGGQVRVEDNIKGDYTQGSNFIILLEES